MAKNKNTILLIVAAVIVLFFVFQGRQSTANFSRTISPTTAKPGQYILVSFTAQTVAPDTPWIGEFKLPTGFSWTRYTVTDANINEPISGTIRFYGMGAQTARFFIIPSQKGTYTPESWIYDSVEELMYTWSTGTTTGNYPATYIIVDCMETTEILLKLGQWLQNIISTEQMVGYISEYMNNKCI